MPGYRHCRCIRDAGVGGDFYAEGPTGGAGVALSLQGLNLFRYRPSDKQLSAERSGESTRPQPDFWLRTGRFRSDSLAQENPELVQQARTRHANRPFYLAKCLIADRAGHVSVMQSLQS